MILLDLTIKRKNQEMDNQCTQQLGPEYWRYTYYTCSMAHRAQIYWASQVSQEQPVICDQIGI